VRAGAGENWHAFVQWTLAQGLGGLENHSLIPGTVGAAPIQNVGAYGAETKDCFFFLTAYDFQTGETIKLSREHCRFAYRDSAFKHEWADRAVILDVTFALPRRWQANVQYAELAKELEARGQGAPTPREVSDGDRDPPAQAARPGRDRQRGQLLQESGGAGGNPRRAAETHPALVSYVQPDGSYKLAAGWLIDQCGWKGRSLGPAGVYESRRWCWSTAAAHED
jgi:UDP-N-acetylmuramate dehydrogenase